ncbi:MAG: hypothetical protein AAGI90_05945 [Chlamydiota bacterium]
MGEIFDGDFSTNNGSHQELVRLHSLEEKPCSINKKVLVVVAKDETSGNFLVRGSDPVEDGAFQYEKLKEGLRELLAGEGFDPDHFYLICYTFLNPFSNHKYLAAEKKFFSKNPQLGKLKKHPLYGNPIDPTSSLLPVSIRNHMLRTGEFDQLDKLRELMQSVKSNLAGKLDRTAVIYWHCRAGKDRTGEASACFQMQFQGMSYQEALVTATKIAGRKPHEVSINAIKWYAFYLRDVLGVTTIGLIDSNE